MDFLDALGDLKHPKKKKTTYVKDIEVYATQEENDEEKKQPQLSSASFLFGNSTIVDKVKSRLNGVSNEETDGERGDALPQTQVIPNYYDGEDLEQDFVSPPKPRRVSNTGHGQDCDCDSEEQTQLMPTQETGAYESQVVPVIAPVQVSETIPVSINDGLLGESLFKTSKDEVKGNGGNTTRNLAEPCYGLTQIIPSPQYKNSQQMQLETQEAGETQEVDKTQRILEATARDPTLSEEDFVAATVADGSEAVTTQLDTCVPDTSALGDVQPTAPDQSAHRNSQRLLIHEIEKDLDAEEEREKRITEAKPHDVVLVVKKKFDKEAFLNNFDCSSSEGEEQEQEEQEEQTHLESEPASKRRKLAFYKCAGKSFR